MLQLQNYKFLRSLGKIVVKFGEFTIFGVFCISLRCEGCNFAAKNIDIVVTHAFAMIKSETALGSLALSIEWIKGCTVHLMQHWWLIAAPL